jgi:hypothetical protein
VQKFNSSGVSIGDGLEAIGIVDHYSQFIVTDDGGFVVLVHEYSGGDFMIAAFKFDNNGDPIGDPFLLGEASYDMNPQIIATDDGGFVVAWHGDGDSNLDVFVQKFDSNGDPIGSKIQLDGAGYNDIYPQITATGDGGFAVAWNGVTGSNYDIFVQKFNSEGSLVSAQSNEAGTAYLVNDTISVSDLASIISSDDDMWNSFDIAWADTPTALSTDGLAAGTYHLYAVDIAGNLSNVSTGSYTIL